MRLEVPSIPWWFYLVVFVPIAFPLIQRLVAMVMEERRFARAGLADVRQMHWREFEQYLAHLFRSLGYQVELTPPAGDNGVDVILTDATGQRIAVQAKHWKTQRVGSPDVQKTVGGAAYYRCQHAIVVTLTGYTDQAREFARQTGVQLWGIKELADAVDRARSQTGVARVPVAAPVQAAPATARTAPVQAAPAAARTAPGPGCQLCGEAMSLRAVQARPIWVCSRFPRCRGTRVKE